MACYQMSSGSEECSEGSGNTSTCHSCLMVRQAQIITAPVAVKCSGGGPAARKCSINSDYDEDDHHVSIKSSLLRLGARTRRFITNPSLIIVLIVVLSCCPVTVRGKPLGSSSSSSKIPSHSSTAAKIVSIDPADWYQVVVASSELGNQLKREIKPPAVVLKMSNASNLGKDTAAMLERAINDIDRKLNDFIQEHWFETGVEGMQNTWGHMLMDLDYLGNTRNFEELGRDIGREEFIRELIELLVRFKRIERALWVIQQPSMSNMEALPAVTELARSAKENVDRLVGHLMEYYNSLHLDGLDMTDLPQVEEEAPVLDNDKLTLYVVLREFLNHMRFSDKMLQRFQEEDVQAALGLEEQ